MTTPKAPATQQPPRRAVNLTPKLYYYTVSGSAPFPLAMLQLDRCFPASPEDVTSIENSGANKNVKQFSLIGLNVPSKAAWAKAGFTFPAPVSLR